MIMVFLTIVGIGRVAAAHQAVQAAAAQAARAASIARTAETADRDGRVAAEATLKNESLRCTDSTSKVDTSQFGRAIGEPANVVATVTCVVDLGDVTGMTPLPGTIVVTKTSTSPIDTFRGR